MVGGYIRRGVLLHCSGMPPEREPRQAAPVSGEKSLFRAYVYLDRTRTDERTTPHRNADAVRCVRALARFLAHSFSLSLHLYLSLSRSISFFFKLKGHLLREQIHSKFRLEGRAGPVRYGPTTSKRRAAARS